MVGHCSLTLVVAQVDTHDLVCCWRPESRHPVLNGQLQSAVPVETPLTDHRLEARHPVNLHLVGCKLIAEADANHPLVKWVQRAVDRYAIRRAGECDQRERRVSREEEDRVTAVRT